MNEDGSRVPASRSNLDAGRALCRGVHIWRTTLLKPPSTVQKAKANQREPEFHNVRREKQVESMIQAFQEAPGNRISEAKSNSSGRLRLTSWVFGYEGVQVGQGSSDSWNPLR